MTEVTCPKCNVLQKLNRNNLCSYCYFNFNNSDNLASDNINDNQNIINGSSIKPVINITHFIVGLVLTLVISYIINFFDRRIFYFREHSLNLLYFAKILLSFIFTFFTYKYLSKRYDIEQSMDLILENVYKGRVIKYFKTEYQFILILLFYSLLVVSLNINLLNDISSIVFPAKKYDIFVQKKSRRLSRYEPLSKYKYYIDVTNWRRNNKSRIQLSVTQYQWEKIIEGQSATIKVKNGLFNEVIWSFKQ